VFKIQDPKIRRPELGSRVTKSFSLQDFAHTHAIASSAAALTLSLALQSSRPFPLLLSQQNQSFCKLTFFGANPSDPSDPFFVKFLFLVNLLLSFLFSFLDFAFGF
jgi:hypothetical protein